MATDTKVVTSHLPIDVAREIDVLAKRLQRSRNWVIKQALTAYIETEAERDRLTREAMASVDAGRVVDHRDVLAWADSLSTDNPFPKPQSRNR